ncbi:RNA polymerase factor sigma-54 [Litorimonas sp. RW-G-Af-16]|uniref:RNA polymerase factor sigma-54 n=1 Tax=Litorimonas sp. RW-G-Af-16 TaxID=3241168 RepID=UPI003AAE5045
MALAPKLQARQGQQLAMTPQLQQAIKLLQLSNIELSAFVEEQLESNPLLERGTGEENRRGEDLQKDAAQQHNAATDTVSHGEASSQMDVPDHAVSPDATAADVGGTVDWSRNNSGGSFNGSSDYDPAANTAADITLSEHLTGQLAMLRLSQKDKLIADYMLGQVDEAGYFRSDVAEISDNLGVSISRVNTILLQLQTLEPTGVFARDLAECLRLQLRENGELDAPMQALLDNLAMLAKHDLAKLAKVCGVKVDGLKDMVARLRNLSPKPGMAYGGTMAQAVEPDVFIRETPQGGWAVELNSDTLPRVLLNQRYYNEIASASDNNTQAREFISECHANANWLVKSLDQRARTILKVASEIVKQQDGFFAYGVDHMRPLKLKDVADAIEMHESTVSRVTSNKFMHTPRGLYELKYFFTAAIPSMDGGEGHSAESVRNKIKILISEETEKTVKSDDKIVTLLQAQGVDIARHTVAKYRESMNIPSSVERRRMFKHGM